MITMQKKYSSKSVQPMNPAELRVSPELQDAQHLMPMSSDDRERLKNDIQNFGEIRDPIKVYFDDNGDCLILGGFNRCQIAIELGWTVVPVEITSYTESERRLFVVMDNLARRHLTREQKSKIVELFLKETPENSNRTISKKLGVDDKTVATVRKKLEKESVIPKTEKRKGADGKIQTISYKNLEEFSDSSDKKINLKTEKQKDNELHADVNAFIMDKIEKSFNLILKGIPNKLTAKDKKRIKSFIQKLENLL